MPTTTDCRPCCTTPVVVNVPGLTGAAGADGAAGAAGTNGTNGVNAFTTTSADFNVPAAKGGTVTISVADTSWMVVGQTLVITGPATFLITAIPTGTTVTLAWDQAPGDAAGNTLISSGSKVSPSGPFPFLDDPTTSYGAGAPQALTNSYAQVLSVQVTLPKTGHYLLFSRLLADLAAATITNQTLTAKLRRTNNTAADITNAISTVKLPVVTTTTTTGADMTLPIVKYNGTAGDIIQLMAELSAAAGAGAVNADEAELIALEIS